MFAALMGLFTAQNNLRMTQARVIAHHTPINNDNNKPKQEEYKPKHKEESYKPKHAKEEERLVSL